MENGGCEIERSTATTTTIDPETEYLLMSKKRDGGEAVTGHEWELYKENVRPLKRGRNVKILNEALKSNSQPQLRKSLLDSRRKLIEAIDEYKGDDPLKPWLDCIKWVQEAFPAGGEISGLILIYEQCVRALWHDERYKDDFRFLKVWLEYAENCTDAEVIYSFLEANGIGQGHTVYYVAYAVHMESKNKIKTANDILSRGLSMNAQPQEKLESAYRKFLARSMRRERSVPDEDAAEKHLPARSFGTLLSRGGNRREESGRSDIIGKSTQGEGCERIPLSVYKDTNAESRLIGQGGFSTTLSGAWDNLAGRKDRNKENKAIPSTWCTYKVPQKASRQRIAGPATASIEIFVDDEESPAESHQSDVRAQNASDLMQVKHGDDGALKRETKLLRQNPLRNFPASSLPR